MSMSEEVSRVANRRIMFKNFVVIGVTIFFIVSSYVAAGMIGYRLCKHMAGH